MENNSLFNKCVSVVLKHEGGYVNHPNDPGGETNFGICKRYYPHLDIKNLTIEKAKEIYHKDYWRTLNLNGINELLALHIFDMGVNAGVKTAVRLIQRIVKAKDDGLLGNMTKTYIQLYNDQCELVQHYVNARHEYYERIAEKNPKLNVFLKGWKNRIKSTHF